MGVFAFNSNAQISYGSLVYEDDFSVNNPLWEFKLRNTLDNPTAIDSSYGKVEDGVLKLKANVSCGWDYVQSIATLKKPLPNDYIIEFRARKMQWCGAFDTYIAPATSFDSEPVVWPPVGFTMRMEGSWFASMLALAPDSTNGFEIIPPNKVSQANGNWYAYRLVKKANQFKAYIDGVLQWEYSGSMLSGGNLHFWTSQAGSTAEIDDLKIYASTPSLEIDTAAVRLRWFAESNVTYQVQWSSDTKHWSNLTWVVGQGATTNLIEWTDGLKKFYRYMRLGEIKLTNGLVAYYPLNGSAIDASGNGNNGVAHNISFAPDRYEASGKAGAFAGDAASNITVDSTKLNFSGDFSVSVWINPTAGSGTEGPRVFSTAGYEVTLDLPSLLVNFGAGDALVKSSIPAAAGAWTHVAAIRTDNQLKLYLNGSAAGSSTISHPPDYSRIFTPKIGGNSGADLDSYGGLIDDLRLYNRALTKEEVNALFLMIEQN